MTTVLVTGGTGFIGGHCILRLAEDGHAVRATTRSLAGAEAARAALERAGLPTAADVAFVEADLTSDAGWADAMEGVDVVLHVASPVRPGHVEDEEALVATAREGTLRVLGAAHAAGVRRVVVTSAFHAVGWGHPHDDHVFTEDDWSDLDGPGVDAYARSKTLAERAAWAWARESGTAVELVTLLPVAVVGPVLGGEVSGLNAIIRGMLAGAVPATMDIRFPIVDVRDVARAHVLAAVAPEAAGRRLLLSDGPALPMPEIARTIREALGDDAARVPTRSLPDDTVRERAADDPHLAAAVPDLGYERRTSAETARRLLGWEARDAREAVVDTARSMVAAGIV